MSQEPVPISKPDDLLVRYTNTEARLRYAEEREKQLVAQIADLNERLACIMRIAAGGKASYGTGMG
jgi:hypothetical protein